MSRRSFQNFRRPPPGVTARLTKPVPWRPMTDEEWEGVMHFMVYVHPARGRYTILGARRSLDACFHAACMDKPWPQLPEHYGKWNSIARLFRRWTHAGLWKRMLTFVAKEQPGMRAIQYWVCRAFRRAWRIQGLGGLNLARRLGLDSAMRAWSWDLPDSNLSLYLRRVLWPRLRAEPGGPDRFWTGFIIRLYSQCMGRATLPLSSRIDFLEQECGWMFERGDFIIPRTGFAWRGAGP